MRRVARPIAIALCLAGLLTAAGARAQVCGDVTADHEITTNDALRVLRAAVHLPVDLVCTDQCAALETRLADVEALVSHLDVHGDNLVLSGQNFQVVSGSGETDGDVNGKGNIIIGYNESNNSSDHRDGSHNLVIGQFHSYASYGGIVAGEDNAITAVVSSVLGGARNRSDGDGSVVVGGLDNRTNGEAAVVVAGEFNLANARSCSVASGFLNTCAGIAAAVSGGNKNLCTGNAAVLGGGTSRTLNTNGAWVAGSLFQSQ